MLLTCSWSSIWVTRGWSTWTVFKNENLPDVWEQVLPSYLLHLCRLWLSFLCWYLWPLSVMGSSMDDQLDLFAATDQRNWIWLLFSMILLTEYTLASFEQLNLDLQKYHPWQRRILHRVHRDVQGHLVPSKPLATYVGSIDGLIDGTFEAHAGGKTCEVVLEGYHWRCFR